LVATSFSLGGMVRYRDKRFASVFVRFSRASVASRSALS
jgi:hypothetical protein